MWGSNTDRGRENVGRTCLCCRARREHVVGAARFPGRSRDWGSIEVGKIADMANVSLDPMTRTDFYERVDIVIRDVIKIYDFRTDGPQPKDQ